MSSPTKPPATGSIRLTRTTATTTRGYVSVPAPPFVACPKCREMNSDKKFPIRLIADDGGSRYDCATCAHVWT